MFTGAGSVAPAGNNPSAEIAAHVKQLNDDIADALSSAIAGKPVNPLEISRFGAEYASLITVVNTTLPRLKPVMSTPVSRVPGDPKANKPNAMKVLLPNLNNALS